MILLKKLKSILSDKWFLMLALGVMFILVFPVLYKKSPLKVEISLDESLPYHIWLSFPYLDKPFVEFPVYWEDRYFRKGMYLIKILACDEGNYLEVDKNKNYYCNGEFLGKAVDTDRNGNKVENFIWKGKVPEGMAFVIGVHKRSYDSRYFGFIDKKKITNYLYPLY